MDNLEQFIRKHAALFDDQEPSPGHFDRFEDRLSRLHHVGKRQSSRKLWLRIAAGLLILAATGLIGLELIRTDFSASSRQDNRMAALPDEIQEILQVFELRTNSQLEELQQLAANCPGNNGFLTNTQNELSQLDKRMNRLLDVLAENPADPRVQTALLQQCKARETLLNDALLQGKMQKCTDEPVQVPSH